LEDNPIVRKTERKKTGKILGRVKGKKRKSFTLKSKKENIIKKRLALKKLCFPKKKRQKTNQEKSQARMKIAHQTEKHGTRTRPTD